MTPVFLRLPNVMRLRGLGRSTIYRLIADRKFPSPVRLGTRAVAWRREDLDRWSEGGLSSRNEATPAECPRPIRTDSQIAIVNFSAMPAISRIRITRPH